MPYITEWVDPEIALEYNGITVHHTYMHDDLANGASPYWYTLDRDTNWEDREDFDIRDLCQQLNLPSDKIIVADILRQAINAGLLKKE